MPPVPGQEGDVRVHPIPAVQPHPRFAARVAAGIFAGEALILTAVALLANRSDGLGNGRVAIPAACALVAALLYTFASTVRPSVLKAAIVLGTVLVSVHALSAKHAPALSGEMLYIWLGLYAAYFFSTRQAAAQLAFMAAAYLGVLAVTAPMHAVAAGWLTLVGILFPAAGVLRVVRDGVTQLVNRLSEAALTDTLTGLKNRLALDRELHGEVERALRSGEPLSVVIGDLDYFKSVNDRLGHRAGDQALIRAGQVLLRLPQVGRLDRPHRWRGVHDPAPGRDRARCLSRCRAHARRCRARVPQRPRGAHVLVRDRHLPRSRPLGGLRDRGR